MVVHNLASLERLSHHFGDGFGNRVFADARETDQVNHGVLHRSSVSQVCIMT